MVESLSLSGIFLHRANRIIDPLPETTGCNYTYPIVIQILTMELLTLILISKGSQNPKLCNHNSCSSHV